MNRVEIVKQEGVTLARMIWSMFRRQPRGYLEVVLAANQDLAALGPELPVGTKVVFPLDKVPVQEPTEQVVRLWD